MFSETFFPMAEADSVPTTVRNYDYQHSPPPSDPTELTAELRRGLRAVPHGGFWCKVKSAGRRLLHKIDRHLEQPLRRPDFPVAPPSSPVPCLPKISPDIHIHPAGRPDILLSPPRLQHEGLLIVPGRALRTPRRHRYRLARTPRQLSTPPGLPMPTCPLPKIACCPLANGPSTPSSSSSSESSASASTSSSSSVNSEIDSELPDDARLLVEAAPYLFFPDEDKENNPHADVQKSQETDAPELSVAGSSNMVPPVNQDGAMTMSSSQTEEIRHAAADREFLEEIGLTPQALIMLLDGTGIEWDEENENENEGLAVVVEEEEEEEEGEEEDQD